METVNRNILAWMAKLGLKRKNLADQLNIDPSYFYKMLTGERRWQLEYLERVANLLKVPLWRLFYEGEGPIAAETPDLLLGPADREFIASTSEEYAKLPVIKLQVMLERPDEAPAGDAAWIMFVKKSLLEGIAMGKTPATVELGVKVR
jgi:transcriptional regulator with XRE-family HTH domain